MSKKYIKQGKNTAEVQTNENQVREIVEDLINAVAESGDVAVRELSEKFDQFSPEDFHLSIEEIEACIKSLPLRVIDDIRFAQDQIRFFAHKQLEAAAIGWRGVLGRDVASQAEARRRYKELARECHPDHGGTDQAMQNLNAALAEALEELPR